MAIVISSYLLMLTVDIHPLHAQNVSVELAVVEGLEKAVRLFEEEKYSEAKEILILFVKEHPGSAEAACYLGRIYLEKKNLDESITWLKKAVELDENDSESHHWLGVAYGGKAAEVGLLKMAGYAKKMRLRLPGHITG